MQAQKIRKSRALDDAQRSVSIHLRKRGDWKQWKEVIEDYAEAVHPGMKEVLKMAGQEKEEVGVKWFRENGRRHLVAFQAGQRGKSYICPQIHVRTKSTII